MSAERQKPSSTALGLRMNLLQSQIFEGEFLEYDKTCGRSDAAADTTPYLRILETLSQNGDSDLWNALAKRVICLSRATESICLGKISDPKRIDASFFKKHNMGWADECKTTAMLPCEVRLDRLNALLPEVRNLLGQLPQKIANCRKDAGTLVQTKQQAQQLHQFEITRLEGLRAQVEKMETDIHNVRTALIEAQKKAHEEVEMKKHEREIATEKKRPGRRAYTESQRHASALTDELEQLKVEHGVLKIETDECVGYVAKHKAEVDMRNEICVANSLLIYIREALILFLQCFVKWLNRLILRIRTLIEHSKTCYRTLCEENGPNLCNQLTEKQWLTCFEEMFFQQMVDGEDRISFADFAFRENIEANMDTDRYVSFMALSYMFSLRVAELVSKHTRPAKKPRKKTPAKRSCSAWEDELERFIKSSNTNRQFPTPDIVLATIEFSQHGILDDTVLPAARNRADQNYVSDDEDDDEELMDMFSTRTSKRAQANRDGMRYGTDGQCYDPVRRLAHLIDVDYMLSEHMIAPYHERFECVLRMPKSVRPDRYISNIFHNKSTSPEKRIDIIGDHYDGTMFNATLSWPDDIIKFKNETRARETIVYRMRKQFQDDANFTKAPDATLQRESKIRNSMMPLFMDRKDAGTEGLETAASTSAVDSMYGPDVYHRFEDEEAIDDDDEEKVADDTIQVGKKRKRSDDDDDDDGDGQNESITSQELDPARQLEVVHPTKRRRISRDIAAPSGHALNHLVHNQIQLMKKIEDIETFVKKSFKVLFARMDACSSDTGTVYSKARSTTAAQSKRDLLELREQRSKQDKKTGYQGRPSKRVSTASKRALPGIVVKQEPTYDMNFDIRDGKEYQDFIDSDLFEIPSMVDAVLNNDSLDPLPFGDYDPSKYFPDTEDRTGEVSELSRLGDELNTYGSHPTHSSSVPLLASTSSSLRLGPGRRKGTKRRGQNRR